jgi:sec-independent protein translocase protein TatA
MVGIKGISIGSLLVVLVIALIIFGTKRLKNVGEDLGSALKGFRKGIKDSDGKKRKKKDN